MPLTKHYLTKDTLVQDRGTYAHNRFSVITEVQAELSHHKIIRLKEGEEILGAERTELGAFLLKQHLLKRENHE